MHPDGLSGPPDKRASLVLNGYVTIKCGNVPKVALSKLSGDKILLASRIQLQPR